MSGIEFGPRVFGWKRPLRKIIATASIALPLFAAVAFPRTNTSKTSSSTRLAGVLRTAHAVQTLPADEARKGRPIDLHVVVLFYDPHISSKDGTLFVHDSTGGIYVSVPARPVLALHEGTEIEVKGISDPGEFAPVVGHASIRILGQGHSPATAPHVTISQMMTGQYDSQWVEVEGVVHSVLEHGHNMVLRIATSDGPISATTIPEKDKDYERLIDARIRIRAVAASQFNHRRQLTGVHLFFPALDDIDVQHYGPPDPFALPLRSIMQLSRYDSGKVMVDRVHLRGSVTLQWPGRFVCIQDASGGLCVQTQDRAPHSVGSVVDVVGFPAIEDVTPTLTDVTFRDAASSSAPPASIAVSPSDAVQGGHSGELVSIEGQVVGLNSDPKEPEVVLSGDGLVFPAALPGGNAAYDLSHWQIGSKVRVLGVCIAVSNPRDNDDRQGPARFQSFRILMRSPADLSILQRPSWWTPRHTILILSIALVVTLAVLIWAFVLHRRVQHQTRLISESEERFRHLAHHDPLTGLPNRALLHQRLEQAIERARKDHTCLALLMMDLDRFKEVNDTLGHDCGDRLLCEAAVRINSLLRRTDTVARMGGDEFIVLLGGLQHVSDACEVAVKILQAVSEPFVFGDRSVPISASIGICAFPEDGETASVLLKNADIAMYKAKMLGRNRFQRYQPNRAEYTGELILQSPALAD